MAEWWTYGLSDFLMFSPRAYWRLVERTQAGLWPLQMVGVAAGLAALWLGKVGRHPRVLAGLLALAWVHAGWAFHWEAFAQVNWAARYLAVATWVQAAMMVVGGWWVTSYPPYGGGRTRLAGLGLATLAVLGYPLATAWLGESWQRAEVFGVMPDPTALATLGLLLATAATCRGLLLVIPVLSLLVSAAMYWLFLTH